jgi:hypothetical protein
MNIFRICAASTALAVLTSCAPSTAYRGSAPDPGGKPKVVLGDRDKILSMPPAETAALSDREYLMRKATLGSRSERLEALDVIQRSNDPAMFEFLMERLKKEDDRFLQIRVMQALSAAGDVRAVPTLRHIARWDQTRVGIEAIVALYDLGDDSYVPRLIFKLRPDEDFPEITGIAHRALTKMMAIELPPDQRTWLNYYRAHRLAPYQQRSWYWAFQPPMPPTIAGTTKIVLHPKGQIPLPKEDVKIRHTNVTWFEFWKPDSP